MLKLLKNAQIYAPNPLGKKDLFIADEKICLIQDDLKLYETLPDLEVFDLQGKRLAPGYIDLHVHITGGGGEQGPASRVPESQLSVFLSNGITTVVGLLGTDGITRSAENLVTKARALTEEGMTAYTLTGSYRFPSHTITESVEKDIVMIPPMIGVKIAISDHRSSCPTGEDLIRLATEARRAGLLSGTAGLVTIHTGSGAEGLSPVFYALDHSDIPAKNLLPTHIGRSFSLVKQGIQLIQRGGYIDFTAADSEPQISNMIEQLVYVLKQDGVTIDHITMSSDGYGSQPRFNEAGKCIGLTYASPKSLHQTLQALVLGGHLPLDQAIRLLTTTPAELLGKTGIKGCIAKGADADLIVYDDQMELFGVFVRGKTAVWDGQLQMKGRFEL